ncbi:integration host factor subunit alpha [Piscinibacter sp. SJAQ100]|uniref:Integration host factor subunit alpha n=1 Tax=Aquariibacter albus TaxID=2759899 RepID=A0A839HHE8_9BURK|nr:integration host factor subunit alpha [Aquariibacter albus]
MLAHDDPIDDRDPESGPDTPAERRTAEASLRGDEGEGGGALLASLETPTLTKAELAELLFERLGLNKRESKDMVEAFFELIHGRLVTGQDVKLSGFGNFQIRRKAPRPGRNPRTGETIPIKARDVVTFHASPKLKALVQGEPGAGDQFE